MKRTLSGLLALAMLAAYAADSRAQPRPDPLADAMIPPQLLLQHADEVGLDAGQKEFIQGRLQKMQEMYPELQRQLQKEVAALGQLLGQEHPDEQEAVAQLDKVLEGERQIKHAQLSLALAIRGTLTGEQRERVKRLQQKLIAEGRAKGPAAQPPESLRAKLQQVQERARKWKEGGKDPSAARSLMEEVQPLMRDGKFKEAEAVLDRALQALEEPKK
ncbi:MAG TPA: hypothetical protein VF796_02830 [Humisphaera sp.]